VYGGLPDTFGFTGAMPQIMRHAGVEALVTIKVTWNETNRLTDNLFRWQGNDGSRVFVHTFDASEHEGYNMTISPPALLEVWRNHGGKDLSDTVIASYGWGDGGGGPDPDQIESLPLLNAVPAIPTVSHGLRTDRDGAFWCRRTRFRHQRTAPRHDRRPADRHARGGARRQRFWIRQDGAPARKPRSTANDAQAAAD